MSVAGSIWMSALLYSFNEGAGNEGLTVLLCFLGGGGG